ncbi:hypothetical protein [Nonomuraea gerenzanensis]|uniref:Uncharacterized protein n=1 Tax=Nonomuraea gerenzanensis TaxID=93944 RepID=A0A1M4E986_9ACTN|nr:hypothetical protein [Nonomuraea gerenzanensis]UBU17703.1 hypothetical protein LCN96_22570 [Nonomuraea gerenzanensis]SBO95477.1 hypothetical protein BN4615_P4993 [Nonomuraea gerenzanensis]
MSDRLDDLERRIDELRAGVRKAMRVRDGATARVLRAELRSVERAWDALVSGGQPAAKEEPPRLVTVREQVHQGLRFLGAAAQPRLIVAVSDAFFGGTIRSSQLTSLRRDEERSFRSAPFGRPYYLCAALTDRLSPARGVLTLSTWPLERRVVGPLSPRVDFLTCAIAVAEQDSDDERAQRLLVRMARNIPGATDGTLGPPDPARVVEAARAELRVHADRDTRDRAELAERATAQLGDAARLFGAATLSTIKKENAK